MTENTKPTPTDDDQPYIIHSILPTGLTVASWVGGVQGDPVAGVVPITIAYGSELLVTKSLRDANRDRNGVSWLEHDSAAQDAAYGPGKHRFGYGPTPPAILAELRAHRRAEIEQKRRDLLATSPAAAKFAAERSFLSSLDAELAALDTEAQGS